MNDKHYQWTPEEQVLLMKRVIALENELEVARHAYISMEERVGLIESNEAFMHMDKRVSTLERARTVQIGINIKLLGVKHIPALSLLDKIKGIFK